MSDRLVPTGPCWAALLVALAASLPALPAPRVGDAALDFAFAGVAQGRRRMSRREACCSSIGP
jgi:hypothetical protein